MTDEAGRQMIERAGERGVRSVERYWKEEAILLGNTDPVPYLSATVDLVVDVLHAVERRRDLFDGEVSPEEVLRRAERGYESERFEGQGKARGARRSFC